MAAVSDSRDCHKVFLRTCLFIVILFSGYDPDNPSKDAYIAARTSLGVSGLNADVGGPYYEESGNEIQFNGEVSGGSSPYTWSWDFGDGSTANVQNPTHTYSEEDDFVVTLTVTDSEGKTATDTTTAYIGIRIPDLETIADLDFTKVKPGSTIEGFIEVYNDGDTGSLLNAEVTEWPDWGTWTINPTEINNLMPEDGHKTVIVQIKLPINGGNEFTGEIKVENSDDSSDYKIIPISVKTKARSKIIDRTLINSFITQIINRIQNLDFLK